MFDESTFICNDMDDSQECNVEWEKATHKLVHTAWFYICEVLGQAKSPFKKSQESGYPWAEQGWVSNWKVSWAVFCETGMDCFLIRMLVLQGWWLYKNLLSCKFLTWTLLYECSLLIKFLKKYIIDR